jgi:hypothetical protein
MPPDSSKANTGTSADMASSATLGNGSSRDVSAKASAAEKKASTSSR